MSRVTGQVAFLRAGAFQGHLVRPPTIKNTQDDGFRDAHGADSGIVAPFYQSRAGVYRPKVLRKSRSSAVSIDRSAAFGSQSL